MILFIPKILFLLRFTLVLEKLIMYVMLEHLPSVSFCFILLFKFHVDASITKLRWAKILGCFLDYLRLVQKGKEEFLRNLKLLSKISVLIVFLWEIYLFRSSKCACITSVVLLVETIFAHLIGSKANINSHPILNLL